DPHLVRGPDEHGRLDEVAVRISLDRGPPTAGRGLRALIHGGSVQIQHPIPLPGGDDGTDLRRRVQAGTDAEPFDPFDQPAAGPPDTTFHTPGGNPASRASAASRRDERGASSAGLCTTVLPHARAAASFHDAITSG